MKKLTKRKSKLSKLLFIFVAFLLSFNLLVSTKDNVVYAEHDIGGGPIGSPSDDEHGGGGMNIDTGEKWFVDREYVNGIDGLDLDFSKFLGGTGSSFSIKGNGDGSLSFALPSGNISKGAYSGSSDKSRVTNGNGTQIDTVIINTTNSLINQVIAIIGVLVGICIIILIGAFVINLIKLGGSSENQKNRQEALNSLGWVAISLAILGSLGAVFGIFISIFR